MKINPTNQQNFDGKIITDGKISRLHKPLVDRNRTTIETYIKDMPFDIVVKESKSKKSLTLSTNVEGADTFVVKNRKPNVLETAGMAITDGMKKSKAYKKMQKGNEILTYVKLEMLHVIDGNFKEAREAHKQLAKSAVEDFDIYQQITNFKIVNLPPEANKVLFVNSMKYKAYCAFSPKTEEEKQLLQMKKEFLQKMKAEKKEIKPQIIDFSKSGF